MNTPKKRFIHWVNERETARLCKERGQPYVGDPIIEQSRFCNVNREHDNVTRWIHENVRPLLVEDSLESVVAQLYVCRIFNDPEVLADIFPWTTHKSTLKRLQKRRHSGQRLLRGAYLVVPHNTSADIEVYTMNLVLEIRKAFSSPTAGARCLEAVANTLLQIKGIGEFMSNQICADLRYQPGHNMWSDWSSFVIAGNGTRRGLERYLSTENDPVTRESNGKVKPMTGDCNPLLLEIRSALKGKLPPSILQHFEDPNNLSNCFCEFDKYERAREGKASLRKYTQSQTS